MKEWSKTVELRTRASACGPAESIQPACQPQIKQGWAVMFFAPLRFLNAAMLTVPSVFGAVKNKKALPFR